MHRALLAIFVAWATLSLASEPKTTFRVKYVAEGVAYLDGGHGAGLAIGMKLTVYRNTGPGPAGPERTIAEVEVSGVAESSAVCEITSSEEAIQPGDFARLSPQDVETIRAVRSFAGSRKYAQVVTFTEGDPLDEEARELVPRPPLPEVNRARGRIGFEYNTLRDRGGGLHSSQSGLVFRGDITRIGGSYWNLSGYWRGRLNSRSGGRREETLTDLLNRTYHLTLFYNNPQSEWRVGFGRFYLPWASSLETIDGGYMGRRIGKSTTVGMFAGSTPDPTSWNYRPDRQMFGTFANYEAGNFDSIHYSTTAGVAVTRIQWRPERQFAFFENALFFKRFLSVYHNLETDQYKDKARTGDEGVHVSRSFLTFRLQPNKILSLDFSHNYFRNVPTFDPRLVGTGLVDKLLFQGFSVGFRLDLPLRLSPYATFGRSDRTGDARRSMNQMYGLVVRNVWRTGVRADARYSRFDSAFGRGAYRSLSFSREIGEALRFEFQAGDQDFASTFTGQNRAQFINSNVDWFPGSHYFFGGGYTRYRGRVQSYDQFYMNSGYRF